MNNCQCDDSGVVESWNDWQNAPPQNPLDVIQQVTLAGQEGLFGRQAYPPGSWGPSPIAFGGNVPVCFALQTDNYLAIADAMQWNFRHWTRNTLTTLPSPLSRVIFLRGGTQWQMSIQLDFGGLEISNIQLTFRDNFGTRGDAQASYPSIFFSPPLSGLINLDVTLRQFGRINMGIVATMGGINSMFEMEWIVVP